MAASPSSHDANNKSCMIRVNGDATADAGAGGSDEAKEQLLVMEDGDDGESNKADSGGSNNMAENGG